MPMGTQSIQFSQFTLSSRPMGTQSTLPKQFTHLLRLQRPMGTQSAQPIIHTIHTIPKAHGNKKQTVHTPHTLHNHTIRTILKVDEHTKHKMHTIYTIPKAQGHTRHRIHTPHNPNKALNSNNLHQSHKVSCMHRLRLDLFCFTIIVKCVCILFVVLENCRPV